ncbi:MAG: TatD family hydrolase [Nanoarchaeota archaeon]|nr:TatD family hydrolase [Nanoarchaeota archaeon]
MKIKYIDVHSHMGEEIFDKDRDKILKECEEKGIFVINCGGTSESNRKSLKLLKYKNVNLNLGIYPVQAAEMSDKEFFEELRFIEDNKDKIVGIGEVGLDFYWITDDAKRQLEVERFKEIIWLANKLRLPLNVHSRKAEKETIVLLAKMAHVPVILHAFGGSWKLAKLGAAEGFYFSIPPNVIINKARQKLLKELPIEKLLTETDAPYLGPTKERNDPRNIPLVIEKIAEIKQMEVEEVRKQILKNTGDVFNIKP